MNVLRIIRRRSFLSELAYMVLNVGLAVAVLFVVRATDSPLPAFLLIILSKWRVFAVRPRYWFANIQANLVDFIVSVGLVVFLYSVDVASQYTFALQILFTLLYIAWLLVLKPRSRKWAVVLQAAVALFVGVAALFIVSYAWPVSLVVLGMWLIGYVTARHVLTQYEEDHLLFLSLLWGLMLAQIGWIAYHWTIAYSVPFMGGARVPQVALVVMCLALVVYKVYDSYAKHGAVKASDVLLPVLFSTSLVVVLLIFFNRVSTGII